MTGQNFNPDYGRCPGTVFSSLPLPFSSQNFLLSQVALVLCVEVACFVLGILRASYMLGRPSRASFVILLKKNPL